jgi:hypothetical protein
MDMSNKSDRDNRANQLNPHHDAFHFSRLSEDSPGVSTGGWPSCRLQPPARSRQTVVHDAKEIFRSMVVAIERLKVAIHAQKLQCTLARVSDGKGSEYERDELKRLADLESRLRIDTAEANRYAKSNADLLAE